MLKEIIIADINLVDEVLINGNSSRAKDLQQRLVNKYRDVGCNLGTDIMENMRIIREDLQSLLRRLD